MRESWKKLVTWVSKSVTLPEDTESIRIRKTTLTLVFLAIIPANLIWTFSFFSLGLRNAGAVNLASSIYYLVGIVFLFRTRNFSAYLNISFTFFIFYILGLHVSLGGVIKSGVLITSGLLAPMGAALLLGRRNTIFWALANVTLFTVLLAFEEQIARFAPVLPASFSLGNGFFTIFWVTILSTFMILYLVRELEIAQNLADRLLFNLLPQKIAAQLKKNPGTIAEAYEGASILFADIVGFTPLSNQLSPSEVIELLNEIYSHFDMLVEKYGAEKIRTIGDNYMVASGVPTARPDHAPALALLALDMMDYCENMEKIEDKKLQFRIGINSGPLIAGVIGNKKFQYDIWGDAVNTASRMESQGIPGKIQVTLDTFRLLKNEFEFVSRGNIDVKGKGKMETWFLVGEK